MQGIKDFGLLTVLLLASHPMLLFHSSVTFTDVSEPQPPANNVPQLSPQLEGQSITECVIESASDAPDSPNAAKSDDAPVLDTVAASSAPMSEKKVSKYQPPDYSEKPKVAYSLHPVLYIRD